MDVDDSVIGNFMLAVHEGSLPRKPNDLHRHVTVIWNELASGRTLGLQTVAVPSFRTPPKRIDWSLLPGSFQKDVTSYLDWCAGSDPFDPDARPRPLAARTVRLRRDQIHAGVTSLVESDVCPETREKPRICVRRNRRKKPADQPLDKRARKALRRQLPPQRSTLNFPSLERLQHR